MTYNQGLTLADRSVIIASVAEQLPTPPAGQTLMQIVDTMPELTRALLPHLPMHKGPRVVGSLFALEVIVLSDKLGWQCVRAPGDYEALRAHGQGLTR